VDHLPLQVGQGHDVVVDDAEGADARGREILQQRRAEAAGADDEHPRGGELRLPGSADVLQHEMAGVAFDFVGRKGHAATIPAPRAG